MNTKKEIFDYENAHSNRITLVKNGKFWRAHEQSAYLLTRHFWTDIKVNGGYVKSAKQEIYYVGFPETSLQEKILDKLPEVAGAVVLMHTETCVIINQIPAVEGFEEWKQAQNLKREQAAEKITPYYGELPIFKVTYDLFDKLLNITRHFQRDVKYVLGEKIMSEGLELNRLIYRLLKEKEKNKSQTASKSKEHKLDALYEEQLLAFKIDEIVESLRFLLRISYDNKCHNTERHIDVSSSIESIRKQFHAWNKSLLPKSVPTYSQTSIMPIIAQESVSETPLTS
ncbi:MAG: four helix bundle protein [Bacteroidales bacterium]|nr:four helix bundle protein [Bacteroidales bacterium]